MKRVNSLKNPALKIRKKAAACNGEAVNLFLILLVLILELQNTRFRLS